MAGNQRKYPAFLAEIVGEIAGILMTRGQSEEAAMAVALEVGEYIARSWGGLSVYIPRGILFACSVRNNAILQEFDGSNYRELAVKYGLTEIHLRNIVKTEQAARRVRGKSGGDEASGD